MPICRSDLRELLRTAALRAGTPEDYLAAITVAVCEQYSTTAAALSQVQLVFGVGLRRRALTTFYPAGGGEADESLPLVEIAAVGGLSPAETCHVVLHELAHVLAPHAGHGSAWRYAARQVGLLRPYAWPDSGALADWREIAPAIRATLQAIPEPTESLPAEYYDDRLRRPCAAGYGTRGRHQPWRGLRQSLLEGRLSAPRLRLPGEGNAQVAGARRAVVSDCRPRQHAARGIAAAVVPGLGLPHPERTHRRAFGGPSTPRGAERGGVKSIPIIPFIGMQSAALTTSGAAPTVTAADYACIAAALEASQAANTTRAYRSGWAAWQRWAAEYGHQTIPAAPVAGAKLRYQAGRLAAPRPGRTAAVGPQPRRAIPRRAASRRSRQAYRSALVSSPSCRAASASHHRALRRRPLMGEGGRQAERHRAPHPHRRPVDTPGRSPGPPRAGTGRRVARDQPDAGCAAGLPCRPKAGCACPSEITHPDAVVSAR